MPPAGGGSGFTMDPGRVRAAAPKFDVAADELQHAKQALEGALQAAGNCWGNDEAGQQFGQSYLPGAHGVGEAFDSLAAALRDMHAKATDAADTFERIDQGGRQTFQGKGT